MCEIVRIKTLREFCGKVFLEAVDGEGRSLAKDRVMSRVRMIIREKIQTGQVDCSDLLIKCASEIGEFLIEVDDHDVELRPAFFGENGVIFFEELTYYHILFNAECDSKGIWNLKRKRK